MTPEELLAEHIIETETDLAYVRMLPPVALKLLSDEAVFVGNNHMHDWPKDKTFEESCKGQRHEKELCINVGDTFAYACADAEPIKPEQLDEIGHIFDKYGHTGLICWVAKQRDEHPLVEILEDEAYVRTWKAMYGDLGLTQNKCNEVVPRW